MKRHRCGRKRFNPHQLVIEWQQRASAALSSATAPEPEGEKSEFAANSATTSNNLAAKQPRHPGLVQTLSWDFASQFPMASDDAIEAGILSEEDATPPRIAAMHAELSGQLLNILAEQDAITDGRRRGVDPKTNAKPRSHAGKERLQRSVEARLVELERNWQSLMGAHEAAFGHEASIAFDKAIRARHAGVAVASDGDIPSAHPSEGPTTKAGDLSAKVSPLPISENRPRRVIARLPVPKPLPQAVKAGHFGEDENGPVSPTADEVREITTNHAEELVELLSDLKEAQRRGLNEAECKQRSELVVEAVSKYAEDFGDHAAEQLLAYAPAIDDR